MNKKFLAVLGLVAAGGIAVVLVALRGGGSGATAPVELGEIGGQELRDLAQGMIYGDPDAPITIMEFGNYQCPACGYFALQVKPQLDVAYIRDGQAKLVYYDLTPPNFPHSFLAARAARCAGDQDRYFDYHDQVYSTMDRWTGSSNPAGHFNDLAEEVGLDRDDFRDCLDSDEHADVVTANNQLASELGISGTPGILVYGTNPPAQRLGGFQFVDIQQAIDAVRAN